MLYATVSNSELDKAFANPLSQFLLILASVAAGAIFLPELSSDLWSLTPRQVRDLVPDDRQRQLAKSLIAANSLDQDWDTLVYDQALVPLLFAGMKPSLVVKNLFYSARVHLNQQINVGTELRTMHVVETTSNSERVLPTIGFSGSYWVSVARTERALRSEYGDPGCLAREFVPLESVDGIALDPLQWVSVVSVLCKVSVTLNGQVQDVKAVEHDGGDLVRYEFRPDGAEFKTRIPVHIAFDFPMKHTEDTFPAIFAGFYCAGATVVSMRIYGLANGTTLRSTPFFSQPLKRDERPSTIAPVTTESPTDKAIFSTGRDSILWPGSGVLFDWHRQSV